MGHRLKEVILSRRPLTGLELDRVSDHLHMHGFPFRQINTWLIDNHGVAFYECEDCFGLEPRLRMPDGSDIAAPQHHHHLQGLALLVNLNLINQYRELLDPLADPGD